MSITGILLAYHPTSNRKCGIHSGVFKVGHVNFLPLYNTLYLLDGVCCNLGAKKMVVFLIYVCIQ